MAGGTLFSVLVAGGWWWFTRYRSGTIASLACCIDQVEKVPEGEFIYATITQGSWERTLVKVKLLGIDNLGVSSSINAVYKSFNIASQDVGTIEEAVNLVKHGKVDFAVIPLLDNINLPPEMGYEIIAYNGLTVFVPFSYDPRRGGIPKELNGQITLEEIQYFYTSEISKSNKFSLLYKSEDDGAIQAFEKEVLGGDGALIEAFSRASHPTKPAAEMLRTMLADFETTDKSSLGFATLSHVMKQCSIYPLAISVAGQDAVQPMVMRDGAPISPKTNLCDDKSLYQPNFQAFRRNKYPLAFPIAVVFPRDNSKMDPGGADSSQPNADRGKITYEPISGRRLRSANSNKAALQEVETSKGFVLSPARPSQEAIDFEAIGEAFLPEPPSEPENTDVAEDEVTEDTIGNESQSNSNER